MSDTTVGSVSTSVASETSVAESAAENSLLDKDAFLEILVAQLANQDPLEPLDQSEFISQMAQFAEVEQAANMADQLATLGQYLKFSTATLVGSQIAYSDPEDSSEKTALVEAVVFEAEEVKVRMDDGSEVSVDRIIEVV
ncbi:MAG: flagellar hook capping FlgD N-terminal domain-containing protein [Synergistota bacterium]|nr:flagellar hook capping FlgD N-terminal domain-containing protein [Synergistota bacterium]